MFCLKKKGIRAFLPLSVLLYKCKLMIEGVKQSQTLLRRVQQKEDREQRRAECGIFPIQK